MKSILFLIPTLGGGGAERVLVNLVNNLDKTKYDITLQTIFKAGVNRQFLDPSVKFIEGKVKQFTGNIHVMKLFTPTMLYRMIVGKKYDIVVSYLEGPTARIVSGCPYKGTKKICWIHTDIRESQSNRTFWSHKDAERTYNKFDRLVFVAKGVKEYMYSFFNLKVESSIVYNTIDYQKILTESKECIDDITFSNEINMVSVGRPVYEKGFDRFAVVHKRLLDSGLRHHVFILGSAGSMQLQDQINRLGVSATFHLLPFKKNPYKYVSKADLFVGSSRTEGFSTAVTEALILGIPVISTLVSGSEELLGNNSEYGLVVENSEEGLFEGLYKLLSNPALLVFYKHKATERGSFFNKAASVAAVENLFDIM